MVLKGLCCDIYHRGHRGHGIFCFDPIRKHGYSFRYSSDEDSYKKYISL